MKFVMFSTILLALFAVCSCKEDTSKANVNSPQAEHTPSPGTSSPSVDWKEAHRDIQEWYSKADSSAVYIKGFHEQGFLISKGKIKAAANGENLLFAADPSQGKKGIVYLLPQNKWFMTLDEAVASMENLYTSQEGYRYTGYHMTPLEQVTAARL